MGRAMVACAALALLTPGVHGAVPLYASARKKLELIERQNRARVRLFFAAEINAWAKYPSPS